MVTHQEIALWMAEQLNNKQVLYQEDTVYKIASKFGDEFTYINQNGNLAIDRLVLKEFRKLTSTYAVWQRGERAWRLRHKHDSPEREQLD